MVFMAAAGALAMRGGAALMGKEGARSVAGGILKTGGPGGGGISKKDSDNFEKMKKKLEKISENLERASPAFKQQMIIIHKTLDLFLRPIGDILAKFVRPMAIWFLKIAVLWYKWLGGMFNTSGQDKPDLAEQQAEQTKEAAMRAATTGEPAAKASAGAGAKETGPINAVMGAVETLGQGFLKALFNIDKVLAEWAGALWGKLIPESLNQTVDLLKETWKNFVGVLQELWKIIGPNVEALWSLVAVVGGAVLLAAIWALNGALIVINLALKGLETVLGFVNVAVEWLKVLWDDLYKFLSGNFTKVIDSITGWIKDKLVPAFESFISKIKQVWNFISSLNPFKKGSKAVGGDINETGMYQLHAGEKVMTAGQSAQSGGNNFTFSPNINISASIASSIDIRQLAKQLADLQERELRRRVSYT